MIKMLNVHVFSLKHTNTNKSLLCDTWIWTAKNNFLTLLCVVSVPLVASVLNCTRWDKKGGGRILQRRTCGRKVGRGVSLGGGTNWGTLIGWAEVVLACTCDKTSALFATKMLRFQFDFWGKCQCEERFEPLLHKLSLFMLNQKAFKKNHLSSSFSGFKSQINASNYHSWAHQHRSHRSFSCKYTHPFQYITHQNTS